jgi:hypothetical protein
LRTLVTHFHFIFMTFYYHHSDLMLPQCTRFVLRRVILKLETVVRLLNPLSYAPLLPWQPVSRRWRRAALMENPMTGWGT